MRTFLAIVFIVSVTIKAGNCVLCYECRNFNESDCEGTLVTCGSCMTRVTETMSGDGNNSSYSVSKTCNLNPKICNITYSVTSDQYQARYTVQCCVEDYCNKKALEVTPRNKTENNLRCPTCYAENEENCMANATAKCTADENRCIVFSGKIQQTGTCQTVAFQGCGAELLCNNSGQLYPDNNLCQNGTMTCSNGQDAFLDSEQGQQGQNGN
ncbi:phospholipase A2 inhibitor and Ly6/PLAUR domain-containing protein-like [Leptodactylus fuscus]|uniref:phospholipase A2 inhibitor and Ly6/PLAUR domain-containing protein-like n=1 Tax=Leptodactylus fuscus TaxID=238119 RepID=UPI003F4EF358